MRQFLIAAVALGLLTAGARAIDEAHKKKADAIAAKAIDYLRRQQDAKTGGWMVNPQGPSYPAITGLIINGMLMQPGVDEEDPAVRSGIAYILKQVQPDGGIYDTVLPSYNTSICLSALARVNTPEAKAAIKPAQDFLKSLQFGEAALTSGPAAKDTARVDKNHPFYGGVGYGNHGRPDLSNTGFFVEALHDSGIPGDDPAIQRALVFLKRVQMDDRINDAPYAKGSRQGGFIYATSVNKDKVGEGQTQVSANGGMIEETLDNGEKVSRLRAYGSMTYAGFKSLIYADLDSFDPRVQAARGWIMRHYTLRENPGMGAEGLYYYFLTFSRALDAFSRDGDHAMDVYHLLPAEATVVLGTTGAEVGESSVRALVQGHGAVRNVAWTFEDGYSTTVAKWFVEFESAEAAAKATAALNNTEAELSRGRKVTVRATVLNAAEAAACAAALAGERNPRTLQTMAPRCTRDWANDLIDRLGELQNEDGSFKVVDKRWLEDQPILITAYALLAVQHAAR